MIKRLNIKNRHLFVLIFFSFVLPLHQKLSTIALVVFIAFSLFYFRKFVFNKTFIILAILYPVYILFDILNSGDFNFKIVEMKASLIAFPLIFSAIKYNNSDLKKACKGFVLGCFVALLICYAYAFYQSAAYTDGVFSFRPALSNTNPDTLLLSSAREGNYFFGSHFSLFHQTVYFAMYLNIALILLMYFGFFSATARIFLLIFFSLGIFQVSNRINLLILVLSLTFYLFYSIKNKTSRWVLAGCALIIGVGILTFNPRVRHVYEQLTTHRAEWNRESNSSLGTRLLVWDASLELIAKNWVTGVGIAKAYEELKSIYKQKRYVVPYRHRLNAHNEFLQIAIECGIAGLLLLIAQLLYLPFAKKRLVFLVAGILFVFGANFLFESVLNRYSGLVCYSFFYCLMLLYNLKKEE